MMLAESRDLFANRHHRMKGLSGRLGDEPSQFAFYPVGIFEGRVLKHPYLAAGHFQCGGYLPQGSQSQ